MATKTWRATVTGSTGFPLDMLRYDACYPETLVDVVILKESIQHSIADGPYQVGINGGGLYRLGPTKARWESFGWTVKEWTWT